MNNSERAKKFLEQRDKEFSVADGFASMKGRMIFRLCLIAVSAFFYYFTDGAPVFALVIGLTLGMYVQDFSWFHSIAKSWGFTKAVTNWQEVERIANENS